jgi:predicted transcriptional regulator
MENQSQPEENLVKKTCRELGITQKELAEIMKVSLPTINRWSYTQHIPEQHIIFMKLLVDYRLMQNKLQEMENFFTIFKKYSEGYDKQSSPLINI